MAPSTWMAEPSAGELRAALLRVVPELARESIALHPQAKRVDPTWHSGYLPSQAPGTDLFAAVARHYGQESGRDLDLGRVMAWHIRTVLGDALWRSEAGVALPGGGDPSTWVEELAQRMREAGVEVARP